MNIEELQTKIDDLTRELLNSQGLVRRGTTEIENLEARLKKLKEDQKVDEAPPPAGFVTLEPMGSYRGVYKNHLIEVIPAEGSYHYEIVKWMIIIHTPRGERVMQQWSANPHESCISAMNEAIEIGRFEV